MQKKFETGVGLYVSSPTNLKMSPAFKIRMIRTVDVSKTFQTSACRTYQIFVRSGCFRNVLSGYATWAHKIEDV